MATYFKLILFRSRFSNNLRFLYFQEERNFYMRKANKHSVQCYLTTQCSGSESPRGTIGLEFKRCPGSHGLVFVHIFPTCLFY